MDNKIDEIIDEYLKHITDVKPITAKAGTEYPFGYEDIVKSSGYITAQCCGSTENKCRCQS